MQTLLKEHQLVQDFGESGTVLLGKLFHLPRRLVQRKPLLCVQPGFLGERSAVQAAVVVPCLCGDLLQNVQERA